MKKTIKRILSGVFAVVFCAMFALSGCGETDKPGPDKPNPDKPGQVVTPEKTVSSISVSKQPDKVDYFVGEEFSAAGGEISVKYSDSSTETKSMTDKDVTLGSVNITINDPSKDSEKKTVTVRYGGKQTSFSITVSYQTHTVTFKYGYAEAQDTTETVRHGETVDRPDDPKRDGFEFDNWYADAAFTAPFEFNEKKIEEDTSIYANWNDVSKKYYTATFDYNYPRAVQGPKQQVEEGGKVTRPTTDPTREGYKFVNWCVDPEGTQEYNFDSELKDAVTIYAKWEKTVSGQHEYVFEAEQVDLDNCKGVGISGTAGGPSMIQETAKVSGNRCVGYLYELGSSITFQIDSDIEISDATIVLRLSAEYRDCILDADNYQIEWNHVYLDYPTISITDVPKGNTEDVGELNCKEFADFTIATNATLIAGMNVLTLTTYNDDRVEGTTMTAMAPIIDCLKITTEAVLTWDAILGLPKVYN